MENSEQYTELHIFLLLGAYLFDAFYRNAIAYFFYGIGDENQIRKEGLVPTYSYV